MIASHSSPVRSLPTLVRTKDEGRALAAQLFPSFATVRAGLPVLKRQEAYFPFWVEQFAKDNLVTFFHWLRNPRNKLYQRAQSYLVPDVVARLFALLDDCHKAADYEVRNRWAAEKAAQHAFTFTDGDGI